MKAVGKECLWKAFPAFLKPPPPPPPPPKNRTASTLAGGPSFAGFARTGREVVRTGQRQPEGYGQALRCFVSHGSQSA